MWFSRGSLAMTVGLVCGTAAAQHITTAVVVGPFGLNASATVTTASGTTTVSSNLPAGTALMPPQVQLSASQGPTVTGTTTVTMPAGPGTASAVSLGFQSYVLSLPPTISSSARGGGDLIVDYTVPASFAGWVRVTATADFFTFGAQYAVDLGDDGTIELAQFITGSAETLLPVAFGVPGLRLRLAAVSGGAPSGRSSGSGVRVELVPRVSIEPFGTPCGHALLGAWSGTPSADAIALQVVAAPPNRLGLLGFGTQRLSVPITPSGCLLSIDPLVVVPFVTDASGGYTFVAVIAPIPGLDLLAQSAVTDMSAPGFAETGNGLALRSP